MNTYKFWIAGKDGSVQSWTGLTKVQAMHFNKLSEHHVSWENVSAFGWEKE